MPFAERNGHKYDKNTIDSIKVRIYESIKCKLDSFLSKIENTNELISQLLNVSDYKSFSNKYRQRYSFTNQLNNYNWKYDTYSTLKDKNGNLVAIDALELNEFMKWIGTGIIARRSFDCNINFSEIREKMWKYVSIDKYKERYFENMKKEFSDYCIIKNYTKTNNIIFFESQRIHDLYIELQRIYKYLLYAEYIDENLHLYWKEDDTVDKTVLEENV